MEGERMTTSASAVSHFRQDIVHQKSRPGVPREACGFSRQERAYCHQATVMGRAQNTRFVPGRRNLAGFARYMTANGSISLQLSWLELGAAGMLAVKLRNCTSLHEAILCRSWKWCDCKGIWQRTIIRFGLNLEKSAQYSETRMINSRVQKDMQLVPEQHWPSPWPWCEILCQVDFT
jgi:hypothetical protein